MLGCTHDFLAVPVQCFEHLDEFTLSRIMPFLVQQECGLGILYRVVVSRLDVLLEYKVGQKAEVESPMSVLEEIQVERINDLLWRHMYV